MGSEMAQIDYFKDVMIICVTIFDHFTRGEISARRNQNRRLGKWNQDSLIPSLLQSYSRNIQPLLCLRNENALICGYKRFSNFRYLVLLWFVLYGIMTF